MGANNLPLVFLNCDRGEIGLLWAGKGAKALFGTFANSVGLVVLVRCTVVGLWGCCGARHGRTLCLAGSGWTGEGLRLLVGGGCDGPIRCEGATGWTGRPIIMGFV